MKKNTPPPKTTPEPQPVEERVEETLPEAVASICSVLVIILFIFTFLGQHYLIPSGSMEKTLLVGDHLLVDRITLAPPTKWMPLVHAREPRRGDIIVFIKPGELDADGKPTVMPLVKRLIGVPVANLILIPHFAFPLSAIEKKKTARSRCAPGRLGGMQHPA